MPDSNPEVNELCDGDPLARALARLRPAPTTLGGTQMIYLAGQAARERSVTFWRRAFLVQSLAFGLLGGAATLHFAYFANRDHQPSVIEHRYVAPPPQEPEEVPMPREAEPYPGPTGVIFAWGRPVNKRDDLAEYLRIRQEVLSAGLGLLPDSRQSTAQPVSPAEFEKSMNLPPGVLTAPYRIPPPNPELKPPPE